MLQLERLSRSPWGWIVNFVLNVVVFSCFFTAANELNMTIETSGEPKCGENIVLTCQVHPENVTVLELSWSLKRNTDTVEILCNNSKVESSGIHCKYESHGRLTLPPVQVQQSNYGIYICKAKTSIGHCNKAYSLLITGGFHSKSRTTPTSQNTKGRSLDHMLLAYWTVQIISLFHSLI